MTAVNIESTTFDTEPLCDTLCNEDNTALAPAKGIDNDHIAFTALRGIVSIRPHWVRQKRNQLRRDKLSAAKRILQSWLVIGAVSAICILIFLMQNLRNKVDGLEATAAKNEEVFEAITAQLRTKVDEFQAIDAENEEAFEAITELRTKVDGFQAMGAKNEKAFEAIEAIWGINLHGGSDTCCTKVKLSGDGEAFLEHPKLYQVYMIEPGYINGKPHYTSEDGAYALRWTGTSWSIGTAKHRLTDKGLLATNEDTQCPNQTGSTWEYTAEGE